LVTGSIPVEGIISVANISVANISVANISVANISIIKKTKKNKYIKDIFVDMINICQQQR
jgi:hypothetical protein